MNKQIQKLSTLKKETTESGGSNTVIEHCINSCTVINLQKRYIYEQQMVRNFGGIWLIWPSQKQVRAFLEILHYKLYDSLQLSSITGEQDYPTF